MPQATQHWLPSQRVHVVYNAADEQLIPIQGNHSIATCPWRSEERNDIAFEHYDPSSPDLGFGFQSQFPFSGHESPQADNCQVPWPWFIPSNGAADLPTPWPITDSSPQSPVGPSAAGHLSSQDLTDINFQGLFQFPFGGNGHSQPGNGQGLLSSPSGAAGSTSWPIIDSSPQSSVGFSAEYLSSQDLTDIDSGLSQFLFGGNEHSQPGDIPWPSSIPPSGAAGPPTFLTTTFVLSARSPVGPSVTGPHVTTEDDLRTVGSPQIQQAAARRRTKDGIYQCPVGTCNATFTELHNLHYHKNAHLGLKPYKCSTCKFAAASPATVKRHMKRHQSRCKDTGHTIEGTREPKSSWTL
ncbi:hypothetical protein M378DRAFT_27710 [Amanita muscaria Koide BX008]|uniref:C2H2-type domain-containing protein n=1 Tax=Amanita muscaria (strain Koide BX008) TaxID=946122 RepID=A0A0C2WN07_AMAMK|nr:hypothetical protein M378DRAFT_27710 [Amanita muscaria Koide BX008]